VEKHLEAGRRPGRRKGSTSTLPHTRSGPFRLWGSNKAATLSIPLAEDLAVEASSTFQEAWHMLTALGKVIARRMVDGQASGIPFVGVLYVRHLRDLKIKVDVLNQDGETRVYPVYSKPAWWFPTKMKRYIRDHAINRGTLDDLTKEAARTVETPNRRFRRTGGGHIERAARAEAARWRRKRKRQAASPDEGTDRRKSEKKEEA